MQQHYFRNWFLLIILLLTSSLVNAQMTLVGQVRTRTELRNGVGNLAPLNAQSVVFTSQRTRLTFGYKWDRVLFGTSIQDVRVWGQDASTINAADGNRLMVHEAWANMTLGNSADTTINFRPFKTCR